MVVELVRLLVELVDFSFVDQRAFQKVDQVLDRPLFFVEVDELPVAPFNIQGVHLLILLLQGFDADCCPLEG